MKEYISIKNFGPIVYCENIELKQFTVLIGESASGKSTFMKIVAFMRYLYKMANIRSYLKHSKITRSVFRMRVDAMLERMGLASMLTNESNIIYNVAYGNNVQYSLSISKKKLCSLPTIKKEHLLLNKVSYISENRNVIPSWAEKAAQNAGLGLGFYFNETNKDFCLASEADKTVDLDYLNIKLHITHPKGKPVQYGVEHIHEKNSVKLREASSGIQSSVPIALIMKYFAQDFSFKEAFNRSVLNYLHESEEITKFKPVAEHTDLRNVINVHIEEPELSLFPDAQCKLVEEMVQVVLHSNLDRDFTMMLATHSPYILNYFNILLNQTKEDRSKIAHEDLAIFRMYQGNVQDLLVQDENKRWIVNTYDLTEMMNVIYDEFTALTES